MNLKAIAEGTVNNALRFDDNVEHIADKRLAICSACPAKRYSAVVRGNVCSKHATVTHAVTGEKVSGCGCPLNSKTRQNIEPCPALKWSLEE